MSTLNNLFSTVTKKTRGVDKELMEKLNKRKKNKGTLVVPKTMKDKVQLAKDLSYKVYKDQLNRIELVTDPIEILKYAEEIIKVGYLAVDTETNGLNRIDGEIAGICLYTPGQKGIYIPVGHRSYMTNMLLPTNVDKEFIKQQFDKLTEANVKYIFHNAKFDMHILYWMMGIEVVPYWDTYIGSMLLNENEKHGLKVLWQKYCCGEGEKPEVASFSKLFNGIEFNKVPPEVGYMYAGLDPIMTYELYQFQADYLKEDAIYCKSSGLEKVAWVFNNIEMPLIKVVFDMEVQGVDIDVELGKKLKDKYSVYMNNALDSFNKQIKEMEANNAFTELKIKHPDLYSKLCVNGVIDVNVGSPQQLAILFYDVLKITPPDPSTPRGTGEEILMKMDHPLVHNILEYRGMSKLLSTYIEAIPSKISKRDNKLHANFNQYGAKTGRFSSDEPNLQNIPSKKKKLHDGTVIDAGHDIRQMFIAGEGNVIVGGDFSQQEPRCLAHMSGDVHMIEAYKDGKDLYATMASKLYNLPYDECKEFRPDGTLNPEGKQRRDSVKPVLLGIMYGRGIPSIADQMGVTTKQAQKIVEDFFESFPQIKIFVETTQQFARDYGFVQTAWGRKRRLPDMQLNPIELKIVDPTLLDDFNPLEFNDSQSDIEVDDETYYKYLKAYNKCWGRAQKQEIKEHALSHGYQLHDNGGFIAQAERQCVNSVIQGSAADMTKLTMIRVHNDPEMQRLGYRLIIPVHDEVLGVCPRENAAACKKRLEEIMVHIVDGLFDIPMKCDIEVTYSWYGDSIEIE